MVPSSAWAARPERAAAAWRGARREGAVERNGEVRYRRSCSVLFLVILQSINKSMLYIIAFQMSCACKLRILFEITKELDIWSRITLFPTQL